MEKVLIPKIQYFLSSTNTSACQCSSSEVVPFLQDAYPELKRMKTIPLTRSVDAALKCMKRKEMELQKVAREAEASVRNRKNLLNLYGKSQSSYDSGVQSGHNRTTSEESDANQFQNDDLTVPKRKKANIDSQFVVPKTGFKNVGGLENQLRKLCQFMLQFFQPTLSHNLLPCGLLVTGPSGCGKTHLVEALCGEFDLPMYKIACTELISSLSGASENKIRDTFSNCIKQSPCVLFFDDIDSILQKREGGSSGSQMDVRIIAQFAHCLDNLSNSSDSNMNSKVLVIGTTRSADVIDPVLRRAGRFDTELCLGMPSIDARKEILSLFCDEASVSDELDIERLAMLTPGFVAADLKAVLREASAYPLLRHCEKEQPTEKSKYGPEYQVLKDNLHCFSQLQSSDASIFKVTQADFERAISNVQPSSKREGFITVPSVTWSDVGALHEIRKELQLDIIYPVKYRHLFTAFNLMSPPGILLTGPPGCGKTLLAKAVANEAGINFISVKGPELLNMYLGESERAVRQVFSRAKNSAPCVIFFDEIDALCAKRRDVDNGGSRVVQQFLTELDGIESREGVFILAATNRPDVIDTALLRPGRFDKILNVPVPSYEDRVEILRALTKNGTSPVLGDGLSLEKVAQNPKCEKFSGADLSALVREASVSALQELLEDVEKAICGDEKAKLSSNDCQSAMVSKCVVGERHFEKAFKRVKSSVKNSDFSYSQFFNKS